MSITRPLLSLAILVLPAAQPSAAQERVVLEDFETAPADRWSKAADPIERLGEAARTGESGGRWNPGPGSSAIRTAIPEDWRSFAALRFSVRPHAAPTALVERTLEVRVRERGGRHAWWRKVSVPAGEWTEVELPLWRFRQAGSPRWTEMESLALAARAPGPIDLDDMVLVPGSAGEASHVLPDEEGLGYAFPDRAYVRRVHRKGPFRLFTDAREVDAGLFLDEMESLYGDFRRIFAVEEPPPVAPFDLFLYREESDYRSLFPGLVRRLYSAELAPPEADGMSVGYLAASSHDPGQPLGRPVFLHEMTHCLLGYHLRLPSNGNWLQEGAATLMQNAKRPQPDLDEQIQKMLEEKNHVPLARLFEAERLRPGPLYLQAMTFLEFLRAGERAGSFASFVAGWREGKKTGELSRELLGLSGDDLDRAWLEFCREKYR